MLCDGWVQWMTAGSGIVYSEIPSQDVMENGVELECFRLWICLQRINDHPEVSKYNSRRSTSSEKYDHLSSHLRHRKGGLTATSCSYNQVLPITFLDENLAAGKVPVLDLLTVTEGASSMAWTFKKAKPRCWKRRVEK
jgi:redox-sensitive bicupin YhaK (pirin superfamily)